MQRRIAIAMLPPYYLAVEVCLAVKSRIQNWWDLATAIVPTLVDLPPTERRPDEAYSHPASS